MHSCYFNGYTAHYNGDLSGMITIVTPEGKHVDVPASLIKSIVAKWARAERIAFIENTSDNEILANHF